jgi:hypothetical protein
MGNKNTLPLSTRLLSNIFYSPCGCWYWTGDKDKLGYGRIITVDEDKRKCLKTHRISYQLHKGPIPEGLFVCHTCDNRLCVNPDHLYAGTHTDNMRDMFARNRRRSYKGTGNHKCRVTEDQVRNIKGLRSIGLTTRLISECRKISRRTVNSIAYGDTWTHIIILLMMTVAFMSSCTEEVIRIEKEYIHKTDTVDRFIDRYFAGVDTVEIPVVVDVPVQSRDQQDSIITIVEHDTIWMTRVDTVWITTTTTNYDTIMVRERTYGDTLIQYIFQRGAFGLPTELEEQYGEFFAEVDRRGISYSGSGSALLIAYKPMDQHLQAYSFDYGNQIGLFINDRLTVDESYAALWRELSRIFLKNEYSPDPNSIMHPFYPSDRVMWSNRGQFPEQVNEFFN